MENIINVLKSRIRVIDTETVKKVEIFDEFGVKSVIQKSELSEETWEEFKKTFTNF